MSDISPVADLKSLQKLVLDEMSVSDLTPLRSLSLIELSILGIRVTDLSPIKGMPLKRLRLDYGADREGFLRSLAGLEFINDEPAAVFWKGVGAR